MALLLESLVGETITVLTNDGRVFMGTLKGFDQATNLVVEHCSERVYSEEGPVEKLQIGLQLIRGDNIAVIGEVDVEVDSQIDPKSVRAAPIRPVVH
uniref:U6 snRNA-associated Sm-like protein LSm8 n=1 Tax=Chromera velia CCMP2878 TaxID=1169474 RepID=A0A0G4G219_9ALVE|mmetsp:Transcript_55410/g.108477  ORF Transcript_55410/g.108477 Transcript_55410/m.108477 type:complete len:97 (-) Transcript_55410:491-781(-)|eukprot:Cvel_19726.t1-p1 / transcript=Cvel_19726.t1 / gene=Cvel_19726 / organism=Chromera_velia_CCMP2878 / gene_product=N-alpha-acetyltransferase 38, NatC auxiliary, putative / transcript_product=N-alpha-acetyltransferase 38, NatC auxiliary, putative / location=Cvel_scaffold1724:26413-26700(-) / protein_length=96 / sequence_SO=supercontig / SO=protein_coding / is_pseudo=false